MAGFATNPAFRWSLSKRTAVLLEDLIYQAGDGEIYVTPLGFETDFATIPRPLWVVASPYERDHQLSAVLHDWMYHLQGGTPYFANREKCDALFKEAMKSQGAPAWKRNTIWAAVRSFGWLPWRNKANRLV